MKKKIIIATSIAIILSTINYQIKYLSQLDLAAPWILLYFIIILIFLLILVFYVPYHILLYIDQFFFQENKKQQGIKPRKNYIVNKISNFINKKYNELKNKNKLIYNLENFITQLSSIKKINFSLINEIDNSINLYKIPNNCYDCRTVKLILTYLEIKKDRVLNIKSYSKAMLFLGLGLILPILIDIYYLFDPFAIGLQFKLLYYERDLFQNIIINIINSSANYFYPINHLNNILIKGFICYVFLTIVLFILCFLLAIILSPKKTKYTNFIAKHQKILNVVDIIKFSLLILISLCILYILINIEIDFIKVILFTISIVIISISFIMDYILSRELIIIENYILYLTKYQYVIKNHSNDNN